MSCSATLASRAYSGGGLRPARLPRSTTRQRHALPIAASTKLADFESVKLTRQDGSATTLKDELAPGKPVVMHLLRRFG